MNTLQYFFKPTSAYIKNCVVTTLPQGKVRIEMEAVITDKQMNTSLNVCFAIENPNWEFTSDGNIVYKAQKINIKEQDMYRVLREIKDEGTKEDILMTNKEIIFLKNKIFEFCIGEMVYHRSRVEQLMMDFFNLTDEEIEKRSQEFDSIFQVH